MRRDENKYLRMGTRVKEWQSCLLYWRHMSELIQVQHCVSGEPWFEIFIHSHSDPEKEYRVMVPWPDSSENEVICECEGFLYRGHCSHQEEAYDRLCRWHELDGPEQQTEKQKQDHVCPRCLDETIKESEYVD